MSNNKKPLPEGYQPQDYEKRGYQPQVDTPNEPKPQSGYTPTGSGDNPKKPPQPPSEE
jgi:hypothetical protein